MSVPVTTPTTLGSVDTITLGDGNDAYVLLNAAHSVVAARDVITDFKANTVGQGVGGLATSPVQLPQWPAVTATSSTSMQ